MMLHVLSRFPAVSAILLPALLMACAGAPIETHLYLLRSDAQETSRALTPSDEIAIGEVQVAPYIDQPGLVLEIAPGEIRAARNHRWAEPPPVAITSYLTLEVSKALQTDILPARFSSADTVFGVRIDQLHGTSEGGAKLIAYWWVKHDDEVLSSYQFAETLALEADGYNALAKAQQQLLAKLAGRIAQSLDELVDPAD